MIIAKVEKHHGSCEIFDQKLKLYLLLQPLSYLVDTTVMRRRSQATKWEFHAVADWILNGSGDSRVLCLMGGAGTGKSTVSAAICQHISEGGAQELKGTIFACHFLKYNDQRKLDPIRMLQSILFQLAPRWVMKPCAMGCV